MLPIRMLNACTRRYSAFAATKTTVPSAASFATISSASASPIDPFIATTTAPPPALHPRNFPDYRQHNTVDGFYWRSPYGNVDIPDVTIDARVWQHLDRWRNKVAIVCGITGRQYTYAQLRDHCAAVAHRLRTEYALRRGDVIAISMHNEPEFAIAVLGAWEAGLVVTTINPSYTRAEHVKQLLMSQAKLIFGTASEVNLLQDSVAQVAAEVKMPGMPIVVLRTSREQPIPSGVRNLAELMDLEGIDWSGLRSAEHNSGDIAMIPFSSGTTGLPKGAEITHRNLVANFEIMDVPLPDERIVHPAIGDFQEVVPIVLPVYHAYAITVLLINKLAIGCKLVTLPRFKPATFLQALDDHRATFLGVVPPLLLFLANDERAKRRHLADVRIVICSAAPSGASEVDRLRERIASPEMHYIQGYGMTELSSVAVVSTLPNLNYDSIGRPVASIELKIAQSTGSNNHAADFLGVDANVEGELLVRGPTVMRGYLNNAEATAASMAPGGWLRTGDVAVYDADGQFFIRDRIKELIKVNAYAVPPAELEDVLRSHPLVLDAGVIGVKDERCGEVPRAYVSVRPGAERLTAVELHAFVAERVAKYKRLTGGIQFIETVPRSATGKILRRMLKE